MIAVPDDRRDLVQAVLKLTPEQLAWVKKQLEKRLEKQRRDEQLIREGSAAMAQIEAENPELAWALLEDAKAVIKANEELWLEIRRRAFASDATAERCIEAREDGDQEQVKSCLAEMGLALPRFSDIDAIGLIAEDKARRVVESTRHLRPIKDEEPVA